MCGQPSGYTSQPPNPGSQPAQQALSIRTAMPSTAPREAPSSPSPQLYPTYPIPIPPAKLNKALKLYNRYRLEEGLAQRVPQHGTVLGDTLLSPAAAQSVISHSSRRYTPSVSTSTYEDRSSLVSFTEEESSPPGTANGSTELTTYDGKIVKPRTRKPLSTLARAKAALIRHLGSCSVCRSRRVPCPLEHHDIDALEKARQSRPPKQQPQTLQHPSHSSVSTSSHQLSESLSAGPPTTSGGSVGQSNTLLGLGQNEQLLQTVPTSTLDPQSLVGDPLAEIQVFAGIDDSPGFSNFFNVSQSDSYQDGQMVPIGVFRHFFICRHHLGGLCDRFFDNQEALEDHFESAHFAITRIEPAERYTCSACLSINDFNTGHCQTCGADGCIEIWIYGNIIRTPSYQRYPPDGQDPFRMDMSSLALFNPYDSINTDSQFGHRAGNVDGFNGSVNPGGYNYRDNSSYRQPATQNNGSNAYGPPPSGAYQNHASRSTGLQSMTQGNLVCIPYWYPAAVQNCRRYKNILFTISLLAVTVALVEMHDCLKLREPAFHSRPSLPAIGFFGVLASFLVRYIYWSVKDLKLRGTQCRPRRCPLHDLPTFTLDCGQTGPALHFGVNGG